MIDAKLVIDSPVTGNDTPIGILTSIPISITLSIADVKDIDKRNSTFSKTISIPGSKDANKLFEHIFEVTTDLNNFNPNLKTSCKYFVKGERVFSGDLQLLNIKKKGISPYESVTYEVSIIGRLSKAFLDLGNALLEDLDLSDLNHSFTWANRNWTPTLGTGYTYPYIDYGITGGNGYMWNFAHFKPAVWEKEYIDRIFDSIGMTYTSNYFNSIYANSILIPNSASGPLKMTNSQINSLSFYANKTTDVTYNIPLNYFPSGSSWTLPSQIQYSMGQVTFTDDTTPPFYDGGNNYNTVFSTFYAPAIANYKFNVLINGEMRVNKPVTANQMVIVNSNYKIRAEVGVFPTGQVFPATVEVIPNYTSWTQFSISISVPSVYLQPGYSVYVTLATDDPSVFETVFLNPGIVSTGTASVDVKVLANSWWSGTSADGVLPLGYTVNMNQCIPKNVKQIDFLMSVIKAENLYMELDLADDNNYIIEKREDFFLPTSQGLDWTDKWDYQQETEIVPMGELDFREYIFTYKSDGDKFNKLYKDSFGEVYGQEKILVDNDFIKNTKRNELIFAATPLVGNSTNTLVYPVLAAEDGINLKPMDCQIRRLYWGGIIYPGSGHYIVNASQPFPFYDNLPYYAYAGHLDNPFNPTIDLCWDNPQLLYYNYPGIIYTNNNLYVRNYKNFIDQITDQNSKIVRMWIYLKASDIANFTFRKLVWIHDSWYIVNKIDGYDPQNVKPCRVELLRLTYIEDPIIENIMIWENGLGEITNTDYSMKLLPTGVNPNGVSGLSDGFVSGQDNIVMGEDSDIIGGYNNVIGA